MFCIYLDYCQVLTVSVYHPFLILYLCIVLMLLVNCFIYYITDMLDWLKKGHTFKEFSDSKTALPFILFIIVI